MADQSDLGQNRPKNSRFPACRHGRSGGPTGQPIISLKPAWSVDSFDWKTFGPSYVIFYGNGWSKWPLSKNSKNCRVKHCGDIHVVVMVMLVLFIIYFSHLLNYFSFINLNYSFIHSFIFSFCIVRLIFLHWYRLMPWMYYIFLSNF